MAPKKRKPRDERRPKNSGTIYPIKNRKGVVIAHYAALEINGRTERRRAPDYEAAEAELAALHELKRRGIDVGSGGQLLRDWLQVWYKLQKDLGELSAGTLSAYRQMIELYIGPKLGHHRLDQLKQEHIQDFVIATRNEIRDYYAALADERVAAGKRPGRRHDGTSTTNRAAIVLKMALDLAVDRKLIPESPYRKIKLPAVTERTVPAPTVAQVAAFLRAVRGHRWEPAFYIYALLGFRLGEGTGLRWCDYDPKARTLTVVQQIQQRRKFADEPSRLEKDDPKTTTSARTVPALDVICDLLDALRRTQLELRIRRADTWKDHDLIFCNRDGGPLWPSDMQDAWRKLWEGAGLPIENTLHDLRHGVATMLDEADVTETQKAAILGHKKQTQTQRYVTARIEAMRRVLERVWADVLKEMEREEGATG